MPIKLDQTESTKLTRPPSLPLNPSATANCTIGVRLTLAWFETIPSWSFLGLETLLVRKFLMNAVENVSEDILAFRSHFSVLIAWQEHSHHRGLNNRWFPIEVCGWIQYSCNTLSMESASKWRPCYVPVVSQTCHNAWPICEEQEFRLYKTFLQVDVFLLILCSLPSFLHLLASLLPSFLLGLPIVSIFEPNLLHSVRRIS